MIKRLEISRYKYLSILLVCCLIFSCRVTKPAARQHNNDNVTSLKLMGEYDIPYNLKYNNTIVGGLSGIDYDSLRHCFFLISDDRSALNPARFYKAAISISDSSIDSVKFLNVTSFLQPNGLVYPNSQQDPYHTPDPESIRFDPITGHITWSSEGERSVTSNATILSDPSIRTITIDGEYVDSFSIPSIMHMNILEKGPRKNGVFEGVAFADHFHSLFVSVEEPLFEDGPRADVTDVPAYIRIIKFDVATRKAVKQFAYKLDPVAYLPDPVSAYKINGVSEILSPDDKHLLVVERSFSTGRPGCVVKVYSSDLSSASDITGISSLKENNKFIPLAKKLILNMNDLGIYIDNIEGVTFGPRLSNGHRTLLFVADNNFNPLEKSQLLLFEVLN